MKSNEINYRYGFDVATNMYSRSLSVTGNITLTGRVDGRDIAADGAKLDALYIGGGTDTTNDAWTGTTDVYTTAGNVSIGTTNAEGYKLNILAHTDGKAAVRGLDFDKPGVIPFIYAEGRLGVFNPIDLPTSTGHVGVLGKKNFWGDEGVGVYAWNADDAASNIALYAVADGENAGSTNYGVYATASGGGTNYAGYFDGDVETTGNLHAIGDITVDGNLHTIGDITVAGNLHATANFTTDGDILTPLDLSGGRIIGYNTLWSSKAVQGIAARTGPDASYGGYFEAHGNYGMGVYASAPATENTNNYGGFFKAAGGSGTGVYGSASGSNGYGGYFSATGDSGIGIYAEGRGMEASYAAKFKGNVLLVSRITELPILELGEGLDYAEGFDVSNEDPITAGTVLVIDPDMPGKLKICHEDYDLKVAGVVAGAKGLGSGVRLGTGQFDHDVALAGRVYCNVAGGSSGIRPGDQLTTSSMPGYAMKADDQERSRGAILGKAMEPLAAGETGQILILVTLQ